MLKFRSTEDRHEIFTILKAFLAGQYEAEKLLYTHVAYTNIKGTLYDVQAYDDELFFTTYGRLWLNRMTETFQSDFDKESMENVHRKVTQGCIKADNYIKELCEFPINGELTIVTNKTPEK